MWTTQRLRIEQLVPAHAAALHAALDDPRVGEHIGGPDVTTVDALEERIRWLQGGPNPPRGDERWINLAVLLRDEGTVIGRLEATARTAWAEIAYVFGPRWWGQGYATEAVRWFVDELSQPELWAAVHPANGPSWRLLERVGFERVETATQPVSSYDDGDLLYVLRR